MRRVCILRQWWSGGQGWRQALSQALAGCWQSMMARMNVNEYSSSLAWLFLCSSQGEQERRQVACTVACPHPHFLPAVAKLPETCSEHRATVHMHQTGGTHPEPEAVKGFLRVWETSLEPRHSRNNHCLCQTGGAAASSEACSCLVFYSRCWRQNFGQSQTLACPSSGAC